MKSCFLSPFSVKLGPNKEHEHGSCEVARQGNINHLDEDSSFSMNKNIFNCESLQKRKIASSFHNKSLVMKY